MGVDGSRLLGVRDVSRILSYPFALNPRMARLDLAVWIVMRKMQKYNHEFMPER